MLAADVRVVSLLPTEHMRLTNENGSGHVLWMQHKDLRANWMYVMQRRSPNVHKSDDLARKICSSGSDGSLA